MTQNGREYAFDLPSGRQTTVVVTNDGTMRVDFTKSGAIDGFFDVEAGDLSQFMEQIAAIHKELPQA